MMMTTDPIADMLTRIRNAQMVRHSAVTMPSSSMRDALARVLTEEPLRAQMRELGLVQAARFTWAETARRTLAIYRRVLAR